MKTKITILITILFPLFLSAQTQFEYDNTGRLIETTYANGTQVNYTYDNVGNRTQTNVNSVAPVNIDLTVSPGGTPSSGVVGGSATVNFTLNNSGTSAGTSSYTNIYLSNNNSYSTNDQTVVGGGVYSAGVPSGGSAGFNTGISFPGNVSAGSYFLIFCADDVNTVAETNENNNCIAVPIVLSSPPLSSLPPVASFYAQSVAAGFCPGDAVQFINVSSGVGNNYVWNFPGGNPSASTSANSSVVYTNAGVFSATLTVFNANGTDSKTHSAYIVVGGAACGTNGNGTNDCISLINYTSDQVAGQIDYQHASNQLNLYNQVHAGAVADYRAGNRVVLKPGFRAYNGSDTHIHIDPCNYLARALDSLIVEQTPIIDSVLLVVDKPTIDSLTFVDINIEQPEITQEVGGSFMEFLLRPNPANAYFYVDVFLQKEQKLIVNLLNMEGKLIDTKVQLGSEGTNTFNFDTAELNTGTYLVEVISERSKKTEKLIIIK